MFTIKFSFLFVATISLHANNNKAFSLVCFFFFFLIIFFNLFLMLFSLFASHLQLFYSMYSNSKKLVNGHTSIVACMNRLFLVEQS
jgi:hypothetical protein